MWVAVRHSSVVRSAREREKLYCYIIKPTALSAGFVNESAMPLCEAKSTVCWQPPAVSEHQMPQIESTDVN